MLRLVVLAACAAAVRAACGQFGEVQEVMMVGGEHHPSCSGRGFGLELVS